MGEMAFDRCDDGGVFPALFRSDDHMQMIRQDRNGLQRKIEALHGVTEAFAQQIDISDEDGTSSMGYYGDEVAVPLHVDPTIIHRISFLFFHIVMEIFMNARKYFIVKFVFYR